jgi:hypothetical protein
LITWAMPDPFSPLRKTVSGLTLLWLVQLGEERVSHSAARRKGKARSITALHEGRARPVQSQRKGKARSITEEGQGPFNHSAARRKGKARSIIEMIEMCTSRLSWH